MDGQDTMRHAGSSRGERAPEDGIMMIEGQERMGTITLEYRREPKKDGRIESKASEAPQHRDAGAHDLLPNLPRLMEAQHPHPRAPHRKTAGEGLDNLFGAPRNESGSKDIDAVEMFRRRHCGNRQR